MNIINFYQSKKRGCFDMMIICCPNHKMNWTDAMQIVQQYKAIKGEAEWADPLKASVN